MKPIIVGNLKVETYSRKFPGPPLSEISGSAPERGVHLSMLELQDTCEGNAPESKKGMHNKVGTCVEILPFCVFVFLKS